MGIFKSTIRRVLSNATRWWSIDKNQRPSKQTLMMDSLMLERKVQIDIYLPPGYRSMHDRYFRTLYFNDGQDMEAVHLQNVLEQLYTEKKIHPIIVVAIHTNHNRINEYGTAGILDYKGRGNKAAAYTKFIINELLPYLDKNYRRHDNPEYNIFAGFSLGGLSAFDIVWSYANIFGKVGVFSGSFWWRSKASSDADPDADRIMHEIIKQCSKRENLQFWLEAGTNDEESDRNNNGIIDAIDDTLDLINILRQKGYQESDIRYVEVINGEHNHYTWHQVLPDFLEWAFMKN